MKRKTVFFVISTLYFLSIWLPVGFASSKNVKWYSYDEGITTGKIAKKKIFLNFYADWCGYCKKMDNETFRDPSVVVYLNDNFVSIRVDADQEQTLASKYSVRGLPVCWFIAEDGEKIGNLPGYIPSRMLIEILRYIHTDRYQRMTFEEFLKDGKWQFLKNEYLWQYLYV